METETKTETRMLYGSKLKITLNGTWFNDMKMEPNFIFIEDDKGNLVDIYQIMNVWNQQGDKQ